MTSLPETPAADCPFCARIAAGETLARGSLAAAVADHFPISPGHSLVVPVRHVADWFALSSAEQAAILELTGQIKSGLAARYAPDGWNIGVNIGRAGGQTVGHVHLHLIPRYSGDRADPRGGVRWILPDKAAYWET